MIPEFVCPIRAQTSQVDVVNRRSTDIPNFDESAAGYHQRFRSGKISWEESQAFLEAVWLRSGAV
jgi:hypothetical protein